MSFKNILTTVLITSFVAVLVFLVGFSKETTLEPQEVYQVYLDGQKIGLIKDKEGLYNLINEEGQNIKEKYKVDQVYPPNGLKITKYVTYDEKISSVKDIYRKIKEKENFTVIAYTITIKPKTGDEKKIYVLKEEDFEKAVNDLIYSFIPKEEYDSYVNNDQKVIESVGEKIESMSFGETVTIKKSYVNADENIFVNSSDLTQYLLFGTTEKQKTYVVKSGEDIETIAFNHQLNTQEFLIANPTFTSADQLLSPGQIVNIGLLNPAVNLYYKKYVVVDEEFAFETETEFSAGLSSGTKYVKQNGENGINRNEKEVVYKNGDIQSADIKKSTEIKPAVPKVVVRGLQGSVTPNDNGDWKWPTVSPYTITSPYGYRWGKLHRAVDVAGKFDSPIVAIEGGIVITSEWQSSGGNVIVVDHLNGYFSEYAHLNKKYVKVGDYVKRGDVIGLMGKTGFATGTHLHFGIWIGMPWASGSYTINPLKLYQ